MGCKTLYLGFLPPCFTPTKRFNTSTGRSSTTKRFSPRYARSPVSSHSRSCPRRLAATLHNLHANSTRGKRPFPWRRDAPPRTGRSPGFIINPLGVLWDGILLPNPYPPSTVGRSGVMVILTSRLGCVTAELCMPVSYRATPPLERRVHWVRSSIAQNKN